MKPCSDCGKTPTDVYEELQNILCTSCYEKRTTKKSLLTPFIEWVQPEINEMFPEPGSFSGLMMLWPPFWYELFKRKFKKFRKK